VATRAAVAEYIDGFYNVRRRHSFIGNVSPLEHELRWKAGELGGSAPEPPGMVGKGTEPEGPALTT